MGGIRQVKYLHMGGEKCELVLFDGSILFSKLDKYDNYMKSEFYINIDKVYTSDYELLWERTYKDNPICYDSLIELFEESCGEQGCPQCKYNKYNKCQIAWILDNYKIVNTDNNVNDNNDIIFMNIDNAKEMIENMNQLMD